MALAAIQIEPGINKQLTETGANGKWVDCDNVRFRYGLPEKIGGWTQVGSDSLIGAPRAQQPFLSLASEKFDALCTNKKQYIYQDNNTTFYDVSPQRYGAYGHTGVAQAVTFDLVITEAVVTVNLTANGCVAGDFVTFASTVTPGGGFIASDFDKEFEIQNGRYRRIYNFNAKCIYCKCNCRWLS